VNVARGGDHPVGRIIAALPDAVSCAMFLVCWFAPLTFGPAWVKNLMIVMLMEFLTVHSGGFIGGTLADPKSTRLRKSQVLLGLGSFYLLFAGAFSLAFEAWWPLLAFCWLLLSKLAVVWLAPLPSGNEQSRQATFAMIAVVTYVLGAVATTVLPLPRFGIDDAVREAAAIPGSGAWVEEPHRVIAFGAIYFAVQAWAKWRWQPGWGVQVAGQRRP
jgi:hypothetical protein